MTPRRSVRCCRARAMLAAMVMVATSCTGGGTDRSSSSSGSFDSVNNPSSETSTEASGSVGGDSREKTTPSAKAIGRCTPESPAWGEGGRSPFNGLGTWIDVYDTSPQYASDSRPPLASAAAATEQVDLMASLGVRTIYVQMTRNDEKLLSGVIEPETVSSIIARAHERGMCVVGWYLPKLADVELDLVRLRTLRDFDAAGDRVDGVGVDIEWRKDVADPIERGRRIVDLVTRFRAESAKLPLAAIVPPAVLMEVVNENFWPQFPYVGLAPSIDVWMPMTYWTVRDASSPYRDAYAYTEESIRRLRNNVGDAEAKVHPIGGIGDRVTANAYERFVQAAADTSSVGLSIYDYATTATFAWNPLAQRPSATPPTTPTTAPATPTSASPVESVPALSPASSSPVSSSPVSSSPVSSSPATTS